jgi:hypothetical protein
MAENNCLDIFVTVTGARYGRFQVMVRFIDYSLSKSIVEIQTHISKPEGGDAQEIHHGTSGHTSPDSAEEHHH